MSTAGDRALHAWGFSDTKFILHADRTVELTGSRYDICGARMPAFLPFVESSLGVSLELGGLREPPPRSAPEPRQNTAFTAALAAEFSASSYSVDAETRLVHSHGQ